MRKTPISTTAAQALAFKGFDDYIEIFKAGQHISSTGKPCAFSRADLDQMVANHKLGAAPAVLGHPKHDDPSYAWTESLKREDDSLYAKFTDVNPAFEQGVESGAYRNRSVSVYLDPEHGWRVRHVGWLGAAPPAIPGLKPVSFAAPEDQSLEFAAPGYSLTWGLENAAQLLRRLRDKMIEKDGLEAADATLPQWQIDSMNDAAAQARTEMNPQTTQGLAYTQATHPQGETMHTAEDLESAVTEARAAATAETEARFAAQAQELKTLKLNQRKTAATSVVDKLVAEGKLMPANKAGMVEFMLQLDELPQAFEFGAADGKSAKKTPAKFFAEFMAAQPVAVKLNGKTDAEGDTDAADLSDPSAIAAAALNYSAAQAAKGITVSSHEAIKHVTSQGQAA